MLQGKGFRAQEVVLHSAMQRSRCQSGQVYPGFLGPVQA